MDEQAKHTPQEFADRYNELTKEYGYAIQAVPVWRLRDDGTYSLTIRLDVAPLSDNPH